MAAVFFLFLIWIAAISASCPAGYTLFNSTQKCYQVVEESYTYFAAADFCSLDDAELVSIHNAFENSFVVDLITDNSNDHWIGLSNMIDGWEFTWQDDTPVNYARWAPNQPNIDKGCVATKAATYTWETQACANQLPFVCIFDPAVNRTCHICPTFAPCPTCPPPPVCSGMESAAHSPVAGLENTRAQAVITKIRQHAEDSGCPPGYIYKQETQKCYKVAGAAATFFGASSACNLDDAELASIHSFEENQLVGDLVAGTDFDRLFWIGLTNLVDNWGQWAWLDDTTVRYGNWAPGNPNVTMSCTAFHSLGSHWTTEFCNLNLPYICEFDPAKTHKCPPCPTQSPCPVCPTYKPCPDAPKPVCDDGWTYYNQTGFCYFVGHNSGVVNGDAQDGCRSKDAYLASIHSDAENYFIVNCIYSSAANPGDAWLGLYRTCPGGANCFANYDRTPMDYWHWNTGEPNDDLGVEYCTEMYIRNGADGYWNDCPCNAVKPIYVCKKPANIN